jgi:hypothetical protein
MLDVHPPHEAAHTWRDFFLHIATIVVGLLIAVGLEQTVEAIHHARERWALIAEMRDESAGNVPKLHRATDIALSTAEWAIATMKAIEKATPRAGVVTVVVSPLPFLHQRTVNANHTVWKIASANGTAALLSDQQAQAFGRLQFEVDLVEEGGQALRAADTVFENEEMFLHIVLNPGGTFTFPAAEAPVLLRALAGEAHAENFMAVRLAICAGASDAVGHGVVDQAAIFPYIAKEADAVNARIDRQ